jgi:hypothetical protein
VKLTEIPEYPLAEALHYYRALGQKLEIIQGVGRKREKFIVYKDIQSNAIEVFQTTATLGWGYNWKDFKKTGRMRLEVKNSEGKYEEIIYNANGNHFKITENEGFKVYREMYIGNSQWLVRIISGPKVILTHIDTWTTKEIEGIDPRAACITFIENQLVVFDKDSLKVYELMPP